MTDKKISQLTQITGADVDDANDELAIVDSSAAETKAITRGELFTNVDLTGDVTGNLTGDVTGNLTGDVTGNLTGDVTGNLTGDVTGELDLTAIAETKADTAVDVFVYDTSRDSDGGAWRKRTQHTSWYNETLNTSTRGSRREFPAVAVIVAESNKVTIYDGDDPALPMWMVFTGTTDNSGFSLFYFDNLALPAGTAKLAAKNGTIAFNIPNVNANGGVRAIDFAADRIRRWTETAGNNGYISPIAEYLTTPAVVSDIGVIVDHTALDVAMTILPDSPIDPATGLPVPTIAVATEGGVSVIKDDGTVVDSASNVALGAVSFSSEGGLAFQRGGKGRIYVAKPPFTDGFFADGDRNYASSGSIPAVISDNQSYALSFKGKETFYAGFSEGLVSLNENRDDATKGMVAYTTSTYNTGWMNGSIKGAFLSDTDDTDLVGSGELVTNGTFDTDTDWTKGTGWTIGSGVASIDGTQTSTSDLEQSISGLVAGKTYVIQFEITALSAGRITYLVLGGTIDSTDITSTGTYTVTMVAGSANAVFTIGARADMIGSIDNISVKLADEDRSVNSNGLVIEGSITRTPVATGADLVAYSGFSDSNYLEQPYNPDLDFGTGDFCVMGWVKGWNPVAGRYTVISRLGANPITFGKDSSSNKMAVFQSGRMGEINSVSQLNQNSWSHIAFVRSDALMNLYINGVFDTSASMPSWDFDLADGVLQVGTSAGSQNNGGSLALLRISATAPTAEQIKKIYEDEKVLFQENAQATLYGSSDAVTALAHDPVTDLLHVGTSDGRSDFQGLRRVDNTTDAVGTAISASNGLVAEE